MKREFCLAKSPIDIFSAKQRAQATISASHVQPAPAGVGVPDLAKLVGERGFEPPAPASRRQCSTRLSYSPTVSVPLGQKLQRVEARRAL